jgi:hypothetical protein
MQIDAALVKEQGVEFAVVVVKPSVLSSPTLRDDLQTACQRYWPQTPIVLMAQDPRGTPKYYGRSDIVRFLASIPSSALPWRRWTVH